MIFYIISGNIGQDIPEESKSVFSAATQI